ncbi:MAG: substrate-binding domain-containing protein [Rhodoferax sp.]|nr:substrate-binding domain-containing protein [Rhodoferax sp.]
MVLMKNAAPAVQDFYAYLASPAAQAVMRRYGFVMPKE